jgi:kumamolisin
VPDLAADADPRSGYPVFVDGQWWVVGGTSAVAPLISGLVALVCQLNGKKCRLLNDRLYAQRTLACRDVTSGSNGAFQGATGYDLATGLGTPLGNNWPTVFR